jgi:hypothetical protein
MKILFVLFMLLLAGCNTYPPISRQDTVKAVKECEDGADGSDSLQ